MAVTGKADLIKSIAAKLGFAQKNVTEMLDELTAQITARAAEGETVNIAGFGRFEERVRAARTGRNPHTGETIQIPESRTINFRPSKSRAKD